MDAFGRRNRFAETIPLDERLTPYAGRTGILRDEEGGIVGYLHLSRGVIAGYTGMLWWKVRGTPREELRWDVVIDRGPGYTGYLQGEYEGADAVNELPRSTFAIADQEYSITWLAGDDARTVREEHFAHLR
jgi:hypothetical protein